MTLYKHFCSVIIPYVMRFTEEDIYIAKGIMSFLSYYRLDGAFGKASFQKLRRVG